MTDSESDDDLIDRVAEQIMLGQDPDVEGLIANAPDMAPVTRDKLRKIARAFGPAKADPNRNAVAAARGVELPFTELGPYKLLSRMGEGGMGRVYLAEHGFLQRRVALKVIRPELALSNVTRQRFHREAMRVAKLQHENIVRVYDAGEHEGVAFLAMEVVEGPGLDDLLQKARKSGERIDVTVAARYARDVARALQCAHAAGIIHRDVKPSNVRITPDGRALLLDFGLSLAEEAASLSSAGEFRGTPQYASPEQIESSSAEIDARTDVYSLGVTLYECLTGDVPFAGAGMVQLFHKILAGDSPPPRSRNERVDGELSDIVMRAMAKRREDRFNDAGEMAEALDAWLARADRAAPKTRRSPTRGQQVLLAGVAIALCTTAWFAFHVSAGGPAAAPQQTSPGVRKTTALFGAADRAFDQRMAQWDPVIGPGAFGSDEDGPGVIGSCVDGMSGAPHALTGGNGSVSGRIELIAPSQGALTLGAGAGIEFSNGRIVALMLVSDADGYELRAFELLREGESRLRRGRELASHGVGSQSRTRLSFKLSWNDTETQFQSVDGGSFSIPSELRGGSRPIRFILIVEQGSARVEDCVLEQN